MVDVKTPERSRDRDLGLWLCLLLKVRGIAHGFATHVRLPAVDRITEIQACSCTCL